MNRLTSHITTFLLFLLLLSACLSGKKHGKHNPRLSEIETALCESPQRALASLDSIDTSMLSFPDLQLCNLLKIKARDKAYLTHSSDSLILTVIEYFRDNQQSGHYPEALYYGGRVYSDMGDYPTALAYYQEALDSLSTGHKDVQLRGNILAQMGWLLNDLGLYSDAVPCLSEVIKTELPQGNAFNLTHDYKLLGIAYMHLKDYEKAENSFHEAYKWAYKSGSKDRALIKVYLAALEYFKKDYDSALSFIRHTPEQVGPESRETALSYAAKIYLKKEIYDSAYIYARKLIACDGGSNRKIGYITMLSPQLRRYLPIDSLEFFLNDYKDVLESEYQIQDSLKATIQTVRYNYSSHKKAKEKAIASNRWLRKWNMGLTAATVAMILIVIIGILYHRTVNQQKMLRLHEVNEDLRKLEASLANNDGNLTDVATSSHDRESLRNEIRESLLKLKSATDEHYEVPIEIRKSDVYKQILYYLEQDKVIPPSNPMWIELENIVVKTSPAFISHLDLLTGGVSPDELHLALLIKCGINTTQAAVIIGKSKPTMSYRRKGLCTKILGETPEAGTFDDIIRLL